MQPTQPMDGILTALAEQVDELDGLVRDLDEDGLARPSRCPGWSISDVLLHLAQTNEMTVASAERRFTEEAAAFGNRVGTVPPGADVDDLAGLAVAAERGPPGKEVYERWRASSAAQAAALGACEAGTRLPWVAGDLAAITLATTRLAETWIHSGDVAARPGPGPDPGGAPAAHRPPGLADPPLRLRPGRADPVGPGRPPAHRPRRSGLGVRTRRAGRHHGHRPGPRLLPGRRPPRCPVGTALTATGPDGAAVLELVRTFA